MIRLVLDPRLRPSSGAPVPVLVSVASWDPVNQDLHAWLAGRLSIDFPWLAESHHSASNARNTHLDELLANCLIVPVLDGLDEIADVVRGRAIGKINEALRPGERLVVTSRTALYRDALRPPSGMEVTLRGAAGITLCPLDAADTAGFLRAAAVGPQARARWEPVIAALGSDATGGTRAVESTDGRPR